MNNMFHMITCYFQTSVTRSPPALLLSGTRRASCRVTETVSCPPGRPGHPALRPVGPTRAPRPRPGSYSDWVSRGREENNYKGQFLVEPICNILLKVDLGYLTPQTGYLLYRWRHQNSIVATYVCIHSLAVCHI